MLKYSLFNSYMVAIIIRKRHLRNYFSDRRIRNVIPSITKFLKKKNWTREELFKYPATEQNLM